MTRHLEFLSSLLFNFRYISGKIAFNGVFMFFKSFGKMIFLRSCLNAGRLWSSWRDSPTLGLFAHARHNCTSLKNANILSNFGNHFKALLLKPQASRSPNSSHGFSEGTVRVSSEVMTPQEIIYLKASSIFMST